MLKELINIVGLEAMAAAWCNVTVIYRQNYSQISQQKQFRTELVIR
jgi:hypothetical protein